MLKNILNVKGAQKLSKKEQVQISGGGGVTSCNTDSQCVAIGNPGCIAACVTNLNTGNKICVFDVASCFGGGFEGGGIGD